MLTQKPERVRLLQNGGARRARISCVVISLSIFGPLAACGDESEDDDTEVHEHEAAEEPDAAHQEDHDAADEESPLDASTARDAGPLDASAHNTHDASALDATLLDASAPDAALHNHPDASLPDATLPDATLPDATLPDAGAPDASPKDASLPDATLPDATVGAGPALNDCTTYVDRTAPSASRTLDWSFGIANSPTRCMKILVGQTVTFNGNLGVHPIDAAGGTTPNPFAGALESKSSFTFTAAGGFGFVCTVHPSMTGTIWVVAP